MPDTFGYFSGFSDHAHPLTHVYYFQPCLPGVVGEEGGRGEEELEDVGTGLFCLGGIKEGKVTILTKSPTRPALYLIFPLLLMFPYVI